MRLSKLKTMKKSFKRLVSLATSILMILNMLFLTPINVFAETTNNDGDWDSKYHYGWSSTSNIEDIVKNNIPNKQNTSTGLTTEADYVVRVGDIDDFGLGWVWSSDKFFGSRFEEIDPFSGKSTTGHYWGSGHDRNDKFKWDEINQNEPNGLDRIITVSSYEEKDNVSGIGSDGYSNRQIRIPQYPYRERAPKITPQDEQGIININHNIKNIKDQNNNFEVKAAKLQMFVDDFQPKAGGATAGGATYQVKFIDDNKIETRIPELEELINHLNQTGPVGKLITFEIPSKYYDLLESNNNLYINIDDPTTGAGDGYAIDFVKLLINPKDLMHEGAIKGTVTDSNTNKPIKKAYVEVNGKWRIYTDEQGNYEIPNVTSGLASVKAYKAGEYIGQTKTIDVVDNQKSRLDFQLEAFTSVDNSIEVDKKISDNLGEDRQEKYEITLEVKNKNIENNKILDNDSTENNSGSASYGSNKISGYVWYDKNKNGKRQRNKHGSGNKHEYGINGVTVKLYDNKNECIMTTKTESNSNIKGYYSFDGLERGMYRVKVERPKDYNFTKKGKGIGNGIEQSLSKADPKTGMTDLIHPYVYSRELTNIGLIGDRYIENVEESITVSDFVIEDEVSEQFDIVPNSFKVILSDRSILSKVEFIKEGNKLLWKLDNIGNKEDVLKVSYKIKRPNKDVKAGIYPTSTKSSTITYKLTDSISSYENKNEFPQVEAELKNDFKASINLSQNTDKNNYKVNEEFYINYTIQPQPIPFDSSYLKDKEIAIVFDRSGSMAYYGRMQPAKEVTAAFVEKFKNNDRAKMTIIPFALYGEKPTEFYQNDELDNLKDLINSLNKVTKNKPNEIEYINENMKENYHGTNIGDGIRKAYYKLKNSENRNAKKYILLMTDGKPDGYSYNGVDIPANQEKSNATTYKVCKTSESDPKGYSLKYAKDMAKQASDDSLDIKTYVIDILGYGNTSSDVPQQKAVLKEIANSAGEEGAYKEASNLEDLQAVYNEISDAIKSELPVDNVFFEGKIPKGFEVVEAPKGFEIEENKVKGNLGGIYYILNEDKTYFEAKPIELKIKVKGKNIDKYELGAKIDYIDIDKTTVTKEFPKINIEICKNNAPEINIRVRDTSGVRDILDITSEEPNERVDKILNPNITLQGDAYADISVKGEDANFFEYQFIKKSETPDVMPQDRWISMGLNEEIINEDVIEEKQGYLNKRSYDVSHGIGVGSGTSVSDANEQFWYHSEKVFKNPLQATTYEPASYSTSPQEYGKWEQYEKEDGTKGEIWATNSIFLNNMSIGSNYREASKFWGYIKVDNTGDYKFGAHSDDGCRGYITANGETKDFVNMFGLQGRNSQVGTTNNVYHLEAGKYYPIYLEYFNWGGSAAFEIKYSNNNGKWNRVPQNWLYPSKDITPGEYAKTIFTGSKGVKFPTESGDYYIAFRTGKDGNVTREGIYGAFTVEGKTELTISKRIIEGNKVQEKNNFKLEYTIQPSSEIPAISTYMENGKYKDKISLTNIQITDEYPEYIENDSISGQKIIKYVGDIEYTKAIVDGETVYRYSGDPIKIEVNLSAKKSGDYVLSEDSKSKITFTDFNQTANREQEFDSVNITVVEKKQAEFDFNRTINKDNVEVNEEFQIAYEITPKIIESIDSSISNLSDKDVIKNITFTETLPEGIKIDRNNLPDGVTVNDNTITWNIGAITYELSEDKTKYIPSIGDKKLKIVVTASSEEEGTYNLENATITYEDIDQSTVSKNINEVDTITVENEIEITTGMFINGEFKSNNKLDLVKGFDIELGVKIENIKDQDIVLEIEHENRINISDIQVYEEIDNTRKLINDIDIIKNGKTFEIKTSNVNIGQRRNYIVMYNVKAFKDASEDTTHIKIRVNSQEKTHEINIVPLPNLE